MYIHVPFVDCVELLSISRSIGNNSLKYLDLLKKERLNPSAIKSKEEEIHKSITELNRMAEVSTVYDLTVIIVTMSTITGSDERERRN